MPKNFEAQWKQRAETKKRMNVGASYTVNFYFIENNVLEVEREFVSDLFILILSET